MTVSKLDILIERFHNKTISDAEHAELLQLLSQKEHAQKARHFFKEVMDRQSGDAALFSEAESSELLQSVRDKIRTKEQASPVRKLPVWKWAGVAAAACLLLIAGYWLLQPAPPKEVKTVVQQQTAPPDLLPGKKNKAVLVLADNTQIELDSTGAGILSLQGNARIRKGEDGQIIYENANAQHATTEPVYNILDIPVGGEYQLVLADGSKVWLNAASRLKFPVNFSGNTREVELTGEAYFEIAKNKSKPFKVHVNNATVDVLGTHFNVNAYDNESRQAVTLLEGSVKVSAAGSRQSAVLKPGQQAALTHDSRLTVHDVDPEEAVAWKNGYFMFVDEDIKSIMKKLSRWYGFTAEYQADVYNERFGAVISKYKNISEVLNMFQTTGTIRFKIIPGDISGKGRKIIVMK